MKETAVEWLIEQLTPSISLQQKHIDELKEKAKEMEKEQIIDAYDEGKSDGYKTAREWDEMVIFSNSEQYFNETYKGGEE